MARVALVLGAGGVVGSAFHAGTLAALADVVGWDARTADVVVGTSAGALVGAMLRAGASPADLLRRALGDALSPAGEALFAGIPWPTPPSGVDVGVGVGVGVGADGGAGAGGRSRWTPAGHPARVLARWLVHPGRVRAGAVAASALPAGRLPTDPLRDAVRALYRSRPGVESWPERTLWICALRLADGARVVFGRPGGTGATAGTGAATGDIGEVGDTGEVDGVGEVEVDIGSAVAASSAIPGYDRPVRIGGCDYVDGGWHSALNADLLVGQRFDLVLISSPLTAARRRPSLRLDLPLRAGLVAQLEREVALLRRGGTPVVVLEPGPADLAAMGSNPLASERRAPVARRAFDSTRAALTEPGLAEVLAVLRSG